MDVIWAHLRAILLNLSDVAHTVLTVSHSNVLKNEYSPSSIKIKTEFRSRLDVISLNAIMVVKMSKPESLLPCYCWKPIKELLKACTEYNEKHSSTTSSYQRKETEDEPFKI